VFAFFIRQHIQQFAHVHIAGAAGGTRIKAARLHLHDFGLATGDFHAKRPHHPDRAALQESADIFAPDRRNVIAEALLKEREQTVAVDRFFGAHFLEHLGGCGVGVAQRIRELAVNPAVFLFAGNREGEDFSFSQILEFLGHRLFWGRGRTEENGIKAGEKSRSCANFRKRVDCRSRTSVLP